MKKYFLNATIFTVASLLIAFWLGGMKYAIMATMLGIIEVSLSFDNAVVNATVLANMTRIWQKRFLTWGIMIAVFGMRFILPIVIIMCAGKIGITKAINIALFDPQTYAQMMLNCHIQIMGFGGTFLLLVSLSFFLDGEKNTHWIPSLEKSLSYFGEIKYLSLIIMSLIVLIASIGLRDYTLISFLFSSVLSLIIYILIDKMGSLFNIDNAGTTIAKNGLSGFLYLEVLDASFSFDGVISSFIITNNIILIALGLGIGAIFIRSLTILLVEKGVLSEYKYLEAGAFYSIFALAISSFVSIYVDVPSIITGGISVFLIALSFISSVNYNRNLKFCKGN